MNRVVNAIFASAILLVICAREIVAEITVYDNDLIQQIATYGLGVWFAYKAIYGEG